MKKLLFALSILGFAGMSAHAQTKTVTTTTTTVVKKEVIADTPNYNKKNYKVAKGTGTYLVQRTGTPKKTTKTTKTTTAVADKSENAKNYKVCTDNGTYHICDQHPNSLNSVKAPAAKVAVGTPDSRPATKTTTVTENGVVATTSTQTFAEQPTRAPQSLTGNNELTPVTVEPKINDSITNATAPYHGERSPQYDGPAKNKIRNLNTAPQSPNALPITK